MRRTAGFLLTPILLAACGAPLATGDDPSGIEGMTPAEVIDAMEALGADCSEPEKGLVNIGFSCVITPNVVSVDGTSITIDEMSEVLIHVGDGNRDTADQLTRAIMSIPYQGSDPHAARAWLAERIDSGDCTEANERWPDGCHEAFGAADLSVQLLSDSSSIEITVAGVREAAAGES